MYHKQLVNHVTTRQKAGMPDEAIQNELILDGWSKDDIKEAFYYSSFPVKLGHFSIWRALHSEVPVAVTLILLILTATGIWGFSHAYGSKTLNYTINLPSIPPAQQA